MRLMIATVVCACVTISTFAQTSGEGPSNDKAQKTYKEAQQYLHQREYQAALESFKKADKQDDGHCRGSINLRRC